MMITYDVFYKMPRWLFWRKVSKVANDAIGNTYPFRILIREDGTRIDLPIDVIVKYSKTRALVIKANEEARAAEAEAQGNKKALDKPRLLIPGRGNK
jgi:hypothetical protein